MVYEVRYYVETPIITSSPIHFDALLAAVHPAMHQLDAIDRFSGSESVVTAPLPIDSAKIGDTWVWCATAGDYAPGAAAYTGRYFKVKTAEDYHYLRARQPMATGPGRNKQETASGVSCAYVRFWASSAEAAELARICRRVRSIGSLRGMGYGNVVKMQISETDRTWQSCLIHDGLSVRNLPEEMVDSPDQPVQIQSTPPYWLPCNLAPGYRIGTQCALKADVQLNPCHR